MNLDFAILKSSPNRSPVLYHCTWKASVKLTGKLQSAAFKVKAHPSDRECLPVESKRTRLLKKKKLGMVEHTFNPSTRKADAGESLWAQVQPGLQCETLSQKQNKTELS